MIRDCIQLCNEYYSREFGKQVLSESELTSAYRFPLVQFELLEREQFDDELSEAEDCRTRMQYELERRISSGQANFRTRPILDYLYRLHYAGYDEDDQKAEDIDLIRFKSCLLCHHELNFAVITHCKHIYCQDCIESAIYHSGVGFYPCVICEKPIRENHLREADSDDIQLEDGPRVEKDNEKEKEEKKERQKRSNAEFKENIKSHFFMTEKLLRFREQVREWRKSRPGQKSEFLRISD